GGERPSSPRLTIRLRPLAAIDGRQVVLALGAAIDGLYPHGGEWLEERLRAVAEGKAWGQAATWGPRIVGVAIETPKGRKRMKLSTLWVAPTWRGRGIGRALSERVISGWLRRGVEEAHLTVDNSRSESLVRTLTPLGF